MRKTLHSLPVNTFLAQEVNEFASENGLCIREIVDDALEDWLTNKAVQIESGTKKHGIHLVPRAGSVALEDFLPDCPA